MCSSGKAASDEASRRLAARENAALIGGVELGNKDPVLASVLMDLSQNASISSSIAVGDAVLGRMRTLGRLHRTSVQQAPFMVLKSPDVPSILVETAYISNPTDERNLRSSRHQDALAGAVLDGVRSYFASNPPVGRPATTLAATPQPPARCGRRSNARRHVIRRGDTLSGIANRYNVSVRQSADRQQPPLRHRDGRADIADSSRKHLSRPCTGVVSRGLQVARHLKECAHADPPVARTPCQPDRGR